MMRHSPTSYRAHDETTGVLIARRFERASSPVALLVGLLASSDRGPGMWFPETSIVHTFFMRFALDIVFLDRDEVVLKVCAHVPPWRIAIGPPGTRSVLETISCVPSVLGSVEPGHRLRLSCDDAGGDGTIEAS